MELNADIALRVLAACVAVWAVSGYVQRVLKSLWIGYRLRHLPGRPTHGNHALSTLHNSRLPSAYGSEGRC